VAYEEQFILQQYHIEKGGIRQIKDSMLEDAVPTSAVDFGLMLCSKEETLARAEQYNPLDEVQLVVVNGRKVPAMKQGVSRMIMLTMVLMVGASWAAWLTAWPA